MAKTARALSVYVYTNKNGYDCTNNGVSSRFKELLVPCSDGPIEYDPEFPPENLCFIRVRELFGQVFCTLVPADGKGGTMAGGNKADTSDARWGRLLAKLSGNEWYRLHHTVDIHDRRE